MRRSVRPGPQVPEGSILPELTTVEAALDRLEREESEFSAERIRDAEREAEAALERARGRISAEIADAGRDAIAAELRSQESEAARLRSNGKDLGVIIAARIPAAADAIIESVFGEALPR
jgi:hypothetical protein